jgi:hypothetical protein
MGFTFPTLTACRKLSRGATERRKELDMYEVRGSAKLEGAPTSALHGWAPTESDKLACGKREALRRYETLLTKGAANEVVDGFIPYCVEIVSVKNGALMLGSTTDATDAPYGPWAKRAAAS